MTVNAVSASFPARVLPSKPFSPPKPADPTRFGDAGLLEMKRHRQALSNSHNSIDQLPVEMKDVAVQGRELFLSQACHTYQHTDDGAKLMLALAFSRALEKNHVSGPLNSLMVEQMGEILKFSELDEQLQKLDQLGRTMITIFSTNSPKGGKTEAYPPADDDFVTSTPMNVEFVDDDESQVKILYSMPVKPAGQWHSLLGLY